MSLRMPSQDRDTDETDPAGCCVAYRRMSEPPYRVPRHAGGCVFLIVPAQGQLTWQGKRKTFRNG